MEIPVQSSLWDIALEQTKAAEEKGRDPFLWAIQLHSHLSSAGVSMPSPDLAHSLVSYIFWDNNVPSAWKFLEKALMTKIVPPLLVLALLSTRVIPRRKTQPAAYRLYMELLKRHAFSFNYEVIGPTYKRVLKSIEHVLHLSQIFGLQTSESGVVLVEFIFSIVWQLLDALLDDEGLLELTPERQSIWGMQNEEMDIDRCCGYDEKQHQHQYLEKLQSTNTLMAVEIIVQFFQNRATSAILCLAHRNM